MHTARRQLNATMLPDGTVLVTGGSSGAGFNNAAAPVFTAERWDPAQNSFTELASATRYRGYHSMALLLPDGRVLSSGGDNQPNAEVFSPPYLFKGARPVVTSSPSSITYGESFFCRHAGCDVDRGRDARSPLGRHARVQHEPALSSPRVFGRQPAA